MARFAIATLGMVGLLALAMAWGGLWAGLALAYITVFAWALDKIAALAQIDHPGSEFPAGDGLSVVLGLVHFPLLFGGVWVLAQGSHGTVDKVLIFLALSLFLGQVSNPNAHELIHRTPRAMRRLGVAVYGTILYGFHASAHVRVHHVHAATDHDPNSARLGEAFYPFALRAWTGAFREGLHAESRLRAGRDGLHPYVIYGGWALLSLGIAFGLAGISGMTALIALSLYAQMQLLLSDYVQHYGLRRSKREGGKYDPVGPQHSWNAPHGFSSALMLNAPRHSDHHAHPARPYPRLELDKHAMPILPYSLPVMAVIALMPPLWRRVMDKRAAKWADGGQPAGTTS